MKNLQNALIKAVEGTAQFRGNLKTEDYKSFLQMVEIINSLERDEIVIGSYRITDYNFPSKLVCLILPNSVTVDGNWNSKDLLSRPKVEKEYNVMTPAQMDDFIHKLNSSYREESGSVKLVDLRKDVTIATVMDDVVVNNTASPTKDKPLLKLTVNFYKDGFSKSSSYDDAVDQLLRMSLR